MGVTGLWTVVAPTARPTQLATLNRKRLAVDASIWIYQFLKAVRDKEGNALRNSHVVGFFRRICKLLYFGIKPVFVFDGGAPLLKRETIRRRVRRREGRREDAVRTAGKLLAVQVARAAEEEEKRRKKDRERERTPVEEELPADAELVYVDELGMDKKERQAGRTFKKKDQYHLPDLDVSIEMMGAPNDPRIMSQAELEDYARQFHSGEDINVYDFSKIDFESPFFLSLPPGDRYNILNAARLRSRLRMGYSKEQLDGMFPDRMAFSKFQIDRVRERNELTQRLMHINGMADDFLDQGGRIAGERGKEYVLVKNDGVEGGWALGVVSNKQGTKNNAIDVDEEDNSDVEFSSEEEEFEDIAIEGLNRIPKSWKRKPRRADEEEPFSNAVEAIARKRQAVYEARKAAADTQPAAVRHTVAAKPSEDDDDLFVAQDRNEDEDDDQFEDIDMTPQIDEDDDLARAIAMSLEKAPSETGQDTGKPEKAIQDEDEDDDDDGGFDLAAALAESRKSKHKPQTNVRAKPLETLKTPKFDGPLPFEPLNLGQSLLGKKKSKQAEEKLSGGFDRNLGDEAFRKERPTQPVPSWFDADPTLKHTKQNNADEEDDFDDHVTYGREDVDRREILRRNATKEIIDVDADEKPLQQEPISVEDPEIEDEIEPEIKAPSAASDSFVDSLQLDELMPDEEAVTQADVIAAREAEEREKRYDLARQIAAENEEPEEPKTTLSNKSVKVLSLSKQPEETKTTTPSRSVKEPSAPKQLEKEEPVAESQHDAGNEELFDWSDSDIGGQTREEEAVPLPTYSSVANNEEVDDDEDESENFEDVDTAVHNSPPALPAEANMAGAMDAVLASQYLLPEDEDEEITGAHTTDNADGTVTNNVEPDNYLSDSDEELMKQLAIEAEEHLRFASTLSQQKTTAQAQRDYEAELKQLRSQQKRDRRDADEVTQTMIQECQALLRLFGLPYITAPMEAEAQCAELVHLGLVDGIVTDDSDIFLFGGTRIYKNMFNAAKFVECYLASDLEKEYALDRRKLIRFAHLLGSDYTEGIPSIGPVTALEILTDFADLASFKSWCDKVQLGRPQDLENQLTTPFRRKFKNTAQKRIFLPPGFPDERVDTAYLHPEVDSDPAEFQWGVPDLDRLRSFLMSTIGWSQERTDEILVPVIRDMNRREVEGTQSNITRFFSGGLGVGASAVRGGGRGTQLARGGVGVGIGGDGGDAEGAAPRNRSGKESGRMKNAYKRLRGEAKRRRKGFVDGEEGGQYSDDEHEHEHELENDRDGEDFEEDDESNPQPAKRQRRKRKNGR